ncbi:MAG: signal recognition particle receptor subunit alpha, partial [Promethearchaeota archaeon]
MFKKMKKGLSGIFTTTLTEKNMKKILKDLEITLLKNDVALNAAEKIVEITKQKLEGTQVGAFSKKSTLQNAIKDAIFEILNVENQFNLIESIKNRPNKKKPYSILVLGVNGTGKTTTIAKLVNLFKKNDISVVVAASDTFRAGAIEQLSKHMDALNTRLIKQSYNADPASVAFDAIDHAFAKKINSVIIDTSGRQVTNKNLLEELK